MVQTKKLLKILTIQGPKEPHTDPGPLFLLLFLSVSQNKQNEQQNPFPLKVCRSEHQIKWTIAFEHSSFEELLIEEGGRKLLRVAKLSRGGRVIGIGPQKDKYSVFKKLVTY